MKNIENLTFFHISRLGSWVWEGLPLTGLQLTRSSKGEESLGAAYCSIAAVQVTSALLETRILDTTLKLLTTPH